MREDRKRAAVQETSENPRGVVLKAVDMIRQVPPVSPSLSVFLLLFYIFYNKAVFTKHMFHSLSAAPLLTVCNTETAVRVAMFE